CVEWRKSSSVFTPIATAATAMQTTPAASSTSIQSHRPCGSSFRNKQPMPCLPVTSSAATAGAQVTPILGNIAQPNPALPGRSHSKPYQLQYRVDASKPCDGSALRLIPFRAPQQKFDAAVGIGM